MEYVYATMILHSLGKEISEENIKKILTAAGAKPDETRIKALIAALDGVDIDEAIKSAAVAAPAAPVAPKEEKKEEKKKEAEEEEPTEEEALEGLGALFG